MNDRLSNDKPLVTIVTPSYNQGKYIKETIESVLNQDYSNIEYWVIDGGSTDGTIEILKSYGDRINWISEVDEGQADAVNKGILLSKGSIIGWLNSDDTYLDGTVTYIVDYMKKNPDIDMVYGEGYFIDIDSNVIDRYNTEKFSKKRLAETCIICQPTAFFTKKIINKVGMLDKKLDLCMDYELWMKMAKLGNIIYIPKYLATSRMYEENKTLSRKNEVHEEACEIIYKHYGYVPIHWLYSYSKYLCKGKFNTNFIIKLLLFNLNYNKKNLHIIINEIQNNFKNKKRLKKSFIGRYDDQWLSQEYRCKIKTYNAAKKLIIIGNHIWPLKEELEVKVFLDGQLVDNIILKDLGNFKKEIVFDKRIDTGIHKIILLMNHYYCPNDFGLNIDKRKLTFKLSSISIVE